MKHLRIQSIKDIERAIWLVYRYIPQFPDNIRTMIVGIFPYITVIAGAVLLSIGTIPFIFTNYPLDPLQGTNLFMFNIILSRILFVLMGIIFIMSFGKLTRRELSGWYNIFYLTLFHLFFVMIVFNLYSLAILLVTWYLMFMIKPYFHE